MGQKVNPVGLRLGINRAWDSIWFAKKNTFGKFLMEDYKIREYISKNVKNSGVSQVLIERSSKKCVVTIYTSRPGFVIGKKATNVSIENALDHVLGFFLVNDVSERDFQKNRGLTWDKGKGFDTFGPIGPFIVTTDELPDYQNLNMFLDVNGKRMQTGNTSKMIFDVKTLVSYMSSCMSLHPGDICCTGTPPGVGENMKPPHFLKGGEEVVLGIDKLGTQKHQVVPYKE